jgi:glycosyltransferase involved in cell wall biosynthesis
MRVLHVVATGQARGGEVFAADLVRGLNAYGVSQRVSVLRSSRPTTDVSFEAPVSILSQTSLRRPPVRMSGTAIRSLHRLAADWSPDIVQAHGGEALKYCLFSRSSLKGRLVYRRIGTAPPWLHHGARRRAYSLMMRQSARIIAVAEVARDEAIHIFHLPEELVVTIPNAVDQRRLTPTVQRPHIRAQLGVPEQAPVAVFVGALTWEKDPLGYLEVVARVLQQAPQAMQLFVGDGPLMEHMQASVVRLGVKKQVRLLGKRHDVANILCASDLMVVGSRADGMEGMPACVIEAGMASIPVAAYAVAGIPEVVKDGVTGRLIAPQDQEALAHAMLTLLEDQKTREEMGRAAHALCASEFAIDRVAPRYLHVYEELLRAS